MARYFLKPVLWNRNGYKKPSGVKATKGSYPHEYGFGHEEWNNSDRLVFVEKKRRFRAFHTERLGNVHDDDPGEVIFLFMIASHDGVQDLVGIAGHAERLTEKAERMALAGKLDVKGFMSDAWDTANVRACFEDDRKSFAAYWKENSWTPSWRCLESLFFWPTVPVPLDARRISGKTRLSGHFGKYQEIPGNVARLVMTLVPDLERNDRWTNILAAIDDPMDIASDLQDIERVRDKTTRKALVDARLGTGRFRADLVERWGGACAVTRCAVGEVLRASHIKPWWASNNNERLDPSNGLLLSANIDALFDRGFVTFDDAGKMLVSARMSHIECQRLGLPANLTKVPKGSEKKYLAYHRAVLFGQKARPIRAQQ